LQITHQIVFVVDDTSDINALHRNITHLVEVVKGQPVAEVLEAGRHVADGFGLTGGLVVRRTRLHELKLIALIKCSNNIHSSKTTTTIPLYHYPAIDQILFSFYYFPGKHIFR
jgi:hypothetical protein